MPYVKKEEYEAFKSTVIRYSDSIYIIKKYQDENDELKQERDLHKINYLHAVMMLRDSKWSESRWKRYFNSVVEVFKVKEYVDMPGCFNPMESIEYIAKQQSEQQAEQQEETKDEINRHGC